MMKEIRARYLRQQNIYWVEKTKKNYKQNIKECMFLFVIATLLLPAVAYGSHMGYRLNSMDWMKEPYAGSLIDLTAKS